MFGTKVFIKKKQQKTACQLGGVHLMCCTYLSVIAVPSKLSVWVVQVCLLFLLNQLGFASNPREVIQPEVMEEMVVSCVIKHLNLVDALQSLINFQYQEEHAEEYDLLCKIMGETFKKLNAMERQLQVQNYKIKGFFSLFENNDVLGAC